ncbi:MAG: glycerophosphodiester phosphodiesterase [Flavobacteriia bacterium]
MFYRCFIIIIVLASCKKKEDYSSVQIFGHGGNGVEISNSIYHDNTQESIDLALAQNGCEGVEIDVQLSKEGTAWLYHDPFLEEETSGQSCINSLNDNQISELHYNSIQKEKLVRLTEAKFYSKTIFLDLKQLNYCTGSYVNVDQLITQILNLKSKNPNSKIYVSTVFEDWIEPFLNENFAVYFETTSFLKAKEISSKYAVEGLVFKNQHISKDEVLSIKTLGKKVVIFEVRSPKGIRSALIKLPDIIISDDIKAALIEKY